MNTIDLTWQKVTSLMLRSCPGACPETLRAVRDNLASDGIAPGIPSALQTPLSKEIGYSHQCKRRTHRHIHRSPIAKLKSPLLPNLLGQPQPQAIHMTIATLNTQTQYPNSIPELYIHSWYLFGCLNRSTGELAIGV